MLLAINPKLPMRNKAATKDFYVNKLGFKPVGSADYDSYLMLAKDAIEIHFFEFKDLYPAQNYGQVYIRTNQIEAEYAAVLKAGIELGAAYRLQTKPWGQQEFAVLDPDNNLLTFGERVV